jgi:thiol-disulfide isomerase/thioredoxin
MKAEIVPLFCLTILASFTRGWDTMLYSSEDDVSILSAADFQKALLEAKKDYLVEFYKTNCAACIRFAPIFKQFATLIKRELSDRFSFLSR